MSTFHPESLRPSTLHTLAKALKKAAPDILGTPCALNQAQELLARTLGHPNWHAAITRAEQGTLPPAPRPVVLTDPSGLTRMLFRTLAMHMEGRVPLNAPALRERRDEALALSLQLQPLAELLDHGAQLLATGDCWDLPVLRDWLIERLMKENRLMATRFHALSQQVSFQEAINGVAHWVAPPPEAWLTDPLVPLGVPLMAWRALWMRLREALDAQISVSNALEREHQMATHPQWGQPAEAALYQEWLTHLRQGQRITEAMMPSLQRLAVHSPYVAWATFMAIQSERQGTLSYGLVQLDTARWLA